MAAEVEKKLGDLSINDKEGEKKEDGGEEAGDADANKACSSVGCSKRAAMACPKCIESNLPVARFCSQTCFKNSWAQHKKAHKVAPPFIAYSREEHQQTPADSIVPPEFRGYEFTGPLRPYRKTSQMKVPKHIEKPDYGEHLSGIPRSELAERGSSVIRVYNAEEIDGIRKACQIGREVLDIAGRAVKVGATTNELDRIVYEACMERDAYPSPLNYYNFPKSVCTSVNEVICHGIPDMRELQEGDLVNIDISTYYKGFHGDLNETFMVGKVDEDGQKLVRCAFDCLAEAMKEVKSKTMYRDIGKIISKVAAASDCSVVRTYCGHGIGELFHTNPNVPHYAKNKAKGVMKPGHIFTIEPMINLGDWTCDTWPDKWSAVTRDGSRSAQFEHTLLVTETGYEILTARENELVMEWKPELLQR